MILASANPGDEAFLNHVSTRPQLGAGFTNDPDLLINGAALQDARGSTALIDTAYASLRQLRFAAHDRKALIITSDGMDNHSRHSPGELLELATETDTRIFGLSLYEPSGNKKPIELSEEHHAGP